VRDEVDGGRAIGRHRFRAYRVRWAVAHDE
jgi:hypothetical protein